MSASRTLLRGTKADRDRREKAGRRIKPGTNARRVIFEELFTCDTGAGLHKYERALHATKGWRVQRVPL